MTWWETVLYASFILLVVSYICAVVAIIVTLVGEWQTKRRIARKERQVTEASFKFLCPYDHSVHCKIRNLSCKRCGLYEEAK